VEGKGQKYTFWFRRGDGEEWRQVGGELDGSFLSTDVAGGFQGVTLGMYARGS
jgi:alpha-N-arabinofuranosidase